MIGRLLAGLCVAASPLTAELVFSVVQSSGETPVNSQVQLSATAAGETLDTHFRIRNRGTGRVPLTFLTIAGAGFFLKDLPILPVTLSPEETADFTVRFQPPGTGSFSALLRADGVSVFVLANASGVATVYIDEDGNRRQIDASVALDFGSVERGSQVVRRLALANQTSQPMLPSVSIAGPAFGLTLSPQALLDPGTSAMVEVRFAPSQAGMQQGELRIDQRRFILLGSAVEPPLPKPILTINLKDRAPSSALQPEVSVRFDPPPRTSGTGRLRIELKPSVAALDDAAVMFLPTGSRTISFSVIEGEANAQFGPAAAVPFQTGTTAGTIVITAEAGETLQTASFEIPPQPVVIDTVQMVRTASGIEVQVSGYDNTRSISQASFTFLQRDGTTVPPGAIQQDVAPMFQNYFANTTVGGAFQMKATFPITGNGGLIEGVKVVIRNSVGANSAQI